MVAERSFPNGKYGASAGLSYNLDSFVNITFSRLFEGIMLHSCFLHAVNPFQMLRVNSKELSYCIC